MKQPILFLVTLFWVCTCFGQRETLDKLDERIMQGDKSAFMELAPYLDSSRIITEHLGYHRFPIPIQFIARRIIRENCLFFENELQIDSSLTKARFLRFLDSCRDHLIFDDTTGEFLVTALTKTSTPYELRALTDGDIKQGDSVMLYHEYPDWVYENRIIKPLADRDPIALLRIASALYKTRARWDHYSFDQQEYIDLMKRLTQEEVGVPNETQAITYFYTEDFEGVAKLNYLIYWRTHYQDYRWDGQRQVFVNTKAKARDQSYTESLFKLLASDNDSIAMDAFTKVSSLDSTVIYTLMNDYNRNSIEINSSLPIFPYKFMRVISRLVQYCQAHSVSYQPEAELSARLTRLLDDNLPFAGRYAAEDSLIDQLSLDEVTQVEYFGLLHEENWESTYSVGRILDRFYSRNWAALTGDKKYLVLYLKKAAMFNDLGIIGMCNKYGKKFENCSKADLNALGELTLDSADIEVYSQAGHLLRMYTFPVTISFNDKKSGKSNADHHIGNLKSRLYKALRIKAKEDYEVHYAVSEMVGKINYSQIGELMRLLDEDTTLKGNAYNFLKDDFGLPIGDDDTIRWKEFENDYRQLNQYQLYNKYLLRINPVYARTVGKSDYQKIYDILKFDVVDAFVGGGGSRREDGVYPLIKLLELRFHTTLGFPHKLCNAVGVYGCDCTDRAKYWMRFLVNKGLAIPVGNEPVSVSHNY